MKKQNIPNEGVLASAVGENVQATVVVPQKDPLLELFFRNSKTSVDKLSVRPVFKQIKVIEKKVSNEIYNMKTSLLSGLGAALSSMPSYLSDSEEPSKDLIPVEILIENSGEGPAQNIGMTLEFPEECKLWDSSDFDSPMYLSIKPMPRVMGGLYKDDDEDTWACAWCNSLGNDLVRKDLIPSMLNFLIKLKHMRLKQQLH